MRINSLLKRFGVALTLAMLIGAGTAQAGERSVWMRFAGTLLQNVEQTEVIVDGAPRTQSKSAFHVKTWGNLGRADITGLALEMATLPPVPDPTVCPKNWGKLADIIENNIVLTFNDLSLLYGNGSGALCLDFATGEVAALIDGKWAGGTQRFRNASGHWSIRFDEAVPVGDAASVLAETGMLRGKLIR